MTPPLHIQRAGPLRPSEKQKTLITWALLPLMLNFLLNGYYNGPIAQISIALFWAVDVAQYFVLPCALLYLLKRLGGVSPRDYFLGGNEFLKEKGYMLTNGVFVVLTSYLPYEFFRRIVWVAADYPTPYFAFIETMPADPSLRWIASLYSAATAGFVESIFFIGLPWLLIKHKTVSYQAIFIIAISIIFGAGHWEQGLHGAASAFVANLIFYVWFIATKTLWPVAIGHAIMDFCIFI